MSASFSCRPFRLTPGRRYLRLQWVNPGSGGAAVGSHLRPTVRHGSLPVDMKGAAPSNRVSLAGSHGAAAARSGSACRAGRRVAAEGGLGEGEGPH